MRIIVIILLIFTIVFSGVVTADVDTLKGTGDIEDCLIYGYQNCDGEITGENCMRYNTGDLHTLSVGNIALNPHRALLRFPGWDETIPDSSSLLLYCRLEDDANDRLIFLYPVTAQFYEGTEAARLIGDYPEPDSGATWNHAWLDVVDADSSDWSSPGGDYTTAVACTVTITGIDQYFVVNNFNRILNYWDTSGNSYGCILINENAFPANSSRKVFGSSEDDSSRYPLLLLYSTDISEAGSRRQQLMQIWNSGGK